MYREITNDLLKWKESRRRKPLIVTGVRQCGKTYIIKEFGKKYYDSLVYINFEANSQYAGIFDYDFDISRIVQELEMFTGLNIKEKSTLLFFDEIQECPKAITSLKYFCEDEKDYHIICAGSLLGVALKQQNISFPVGKVNRMQMYPMNFKEFLMATGYEKYIPLLNNWQTNREIPDLYTVPLINQLKNYYIVGGMPEVVLEWNENHNFETVEEIQEEILIDYSDDFAKHAPLQEVMKIRWIWDSIPVQLAKDNNKFIFSHVKEGKRAAELENALQWLVDAGLVRKLELVSNVVIPLSANSNTTYFKVYMSDVGLLRKKSGIPYKAILEKNDLYKEYKGAFTENYVMNELIYLGIKPYFWKSGNTAEIDFIFENQNDVVPVEVKSAENTQAKSYKQFVKKYNASRGFKISMKNIADNKVENTNTISLPLYLVWNIKNYL